MRRIPGLVALVALVAPVVLGGCQGEPAQPPPPPSTAPVTGAPAGCTAPIMGPVDAGSVLVPGPINGLPASDAGGDPLTIVATVLTPDCAPASGASVRVWHADARGLYGPSSGRDECCYYGGTVTADANGRFRLDTIRPAQYPQAGAPPAHIHLEVRDPSGRLDTELVFDAGAPAAGPVRPAPVLPVVLDRPGHPWYGEATLVLEA